MKDSNYKLGALKRKLGVKSQDFQPGELISKMNEKKGSRIIKDSPKLSKRDVAIRGLV